MAHKSRGQLRSALVRADKLRVEGKLDQAERLLRELLTHTPRSDAAWLCLAKLLAARSDGAAAERAYREVLALQPSCFDALVNLAILLSQRGALHEALAQLERALAQQPEHPLALRNYGGMLRGVGALDRAVEVLTRVVELTPRDAGAHTNLGLALSAQGEHGRALVHLERAVSLAPHELLYHDNLLLLMHYASELSREEVFAAHQRYGRVARQLFPEQASPWPAASGARKLRLGYVSADFRRHSVAFFLDPLIAAHDRDRFELYAYSSVQQADAITERFRARFDHFREVASLSDAALCALIRRDRIDVLVDLSGHTHGNRLAVFAQKAAPVQFTYLGYPDTTGLDAIDYRISDPWSDPAPLAESFHSEKVLRLESGFLRYAAAEGCPLPAPVPSSQGRPPTFGSFNALAKVSDATLVLWRRLLEGTPEARLLIKHSFLSHESSRSTFAQRLTRHGIDLARVTLRGHEGELTAHMAAYADVDVALDTYPYHGTTTTCDALYMGVPVVTLAGAAHVSRVGVSLLARTGLADLAADSDDAYIDKARALLRDEGRRIELRRTLRERMHEAGLTRGDAVTRAFERAILDAYDARAQPPPDLQAQARPEVALPDDEARWLTFGTGIDIAVPESRSQITRYALEEQGDWFDEEIHFVRRLLRTGDTALVVGANHGVYGLTMAKTVGPSGTIVAVEPSSQVAARLRASAQRNGFAQLTVLACAASDQRGEARLLLAASSELNAIARGSSASASAAGERVAVETIDAIVAQQALTNVSFVKLDVEGEERNALRGASALIARDQPLWMVEHKHGDQVNVGLGEALAAAGHQLYRLVPGLQLLFPHPLGTDSDPFLLNVFAATPPRAHDLEQRGLLARMASEPALPGDSSYREALAHTVLAGRGDLARGFDQETNGVAKHKQALALYALSQRLTLAPDARALSLRRALEVALSAIEDPHDLSRLMTLARLAWAWGRRAIAIEALSTALTAVNQGRARIDEPFLPPSPRYDAIDPGARLSDWAVSSLLEQLEQLRAFSGFFDRHPQEAVGRLELLARLGFASREMAQRLSLVRARTSA